jgi:murein DD-endopeptidase MepM/ murein hydrolase activator NlpD
MADGVVGGTGDTDTACAGASFGKFVFVRFDNHLSAVYAHLSIISVKSGQKVTRGQLLGYSGSSGRVTAPHLHITLYADIDAAGNNIVKVEGQPSLSCKGKVIVQPRAPREAYLNLLDYTPKTTPAMFKAGIALD